MPSSKWGVDRWVSIVSLIATLGFGIYSIIPVAPSRLVSREVHTVVDANGAWSRAEIERFQP